MKGSETAANSSTKAVRKRQWKGSKKQWKTSDEGSEKAAIKAAKRQWKGVALMQSERADLNVDLRLDRRGGGVPQPLLVVRHRVRDGVVGEHLRVRLEPADVPEEDRR